MIRIDINDITIDLLPDTELELVSESPLMDFDKIQGPFSLTNTIPATGTNKQVFNFPDVLETKDLIGYKLQPCKVWSDGILVLNGLAKLTEVEGNLNSVVGSYKLSIGGELGSFIPLVRNKNLRSLTLSGDVPPAYPGAAVWQYEMLQSTTATVDTYNYVSYPVYAYYDSPLGYPSWKFLNKWNFNTDNFFDAAGFRTKVFHPYLKYILQCIFKETGFYLDDTQITRDADFKQITILGTDMASNYLSRTLPSMSIGEALCSLRKLFNAHFFVDKVSKRVRFLSYNEIVNESEIIDLNGKLVADFTMEYKEGNGVKFMQKADASDDYTYMEEIDFNVHTKVDENVLFSALPAPTEIASNMVLVFNENNYYNDTLVRTRLNTNFSKYEVGDGDRTIETTALALSEEINSLLMVVSGGLGTANKILVPRINIPDHYSVLKSNCSVLRLAFYRGMQAAENSQTYPFATGGMHTYDGTQVGAWHLGWDGHGGLISKWWQQWIDNQTQNPYIFKTSLALNYNDYLNMDYSKRYRIGNATYLLASANWKFPIRKPIECKFWRIA